MARLPGSSLRRRRTPTSREETQLRCAQQSVYISVPPRGHQRLQHGRCSQTLREIQEQAHRHNGDYSQRH